MLAALSGTPALGPKSGAFQQQNDYNKRERHRDDHGPILPQQATADQEQNGK
jgi:hypothetical protein